MRTIDITAAMHALLTAMQTFVAWMRSTYIGNGGIRVSIFDIVVTAMAVVIIIESFVPWGGGEEDE